MLKLDIDGFSEEEVLEYVLVGLEKTREQVTGEITKIKAKLAGARPAAGTKTPANKATPTTTGKKRQLSEEARQRIAAGQHKRWKNAKKAKKAAEAAAQAPATQEAEPLAEAV